MKFNRQIFFSTYRAAFGELTQEQVDGLNSLLHNFETYYGWWNDVDQIANALSQIKHETAHSFQPVCEAYYLGDPNKPNFYQGNTDRVRRVQQGFRYYPYFGRSYIQLTWAENYEKFNALLRRYFPELVQQLELRTGESLDLMAKPNQALDPDVSFAIMTIGMHKGIFRAGHTLDRYINAVEVDHFAAREIVNGDKNYRVKLSSERIGVRIANEALKFTKILKASLEKDSADAPADVPATPTAEDVHAVEPTPTGNNLTGLQPQEQPPTIQQAENIINNDTALQPVPFVPETLTMEAPAKDGATTTATKATFLGFAIPGSLYLAFETVSQWVKDGVIDIKQILDPLIGLIRDNIRYIPYLVGFIVSVVVVKKVFKQITFLVQMIINANPNWHNVNIVPFVAEEREKRWYQFWK